MTTKKPPFPSDSMALILELASKQGTNIWYVPLVDGKGAQSRTAGRYRTIWTCQRHGWLDRQTDALTASGREVLNIWRDTRSGRCDG